MTICGHFTFASLAGTRSALSSSFHFIKNFKSPATFVAPIILSGSSPRPKPSRRVRFGFADKSSSAGIKEMFKYFQRCQNIRGTYSNCCQWRSTFFFPSNFHLKIRQILRVDCSRIPLSILDRYWLLAPKCCLPPGSLSTSRNIRSLKGKNGT